MGDDAVQQMGEDERRQMGRKHVFAVNDDLDFLNLLRALFQHADYNVTTTNFAPLTFDQIAALDPDLLLVDLAWGDRAGWDLLERLSRGARTRGIPVVVTATTPAYLDRVRADPARYGGDALLGKPFGIDDVLGAVRRLIGPA